MFQCLNRFNKYFLILLIFSVPVSTALTNAVLGLIALCWLLDNGADRFVRWGRILKSNPVALMGVVVFLMHVAGLFHTEGEKEKIIESLSDGARFLSISMIMVYFQTRETRPVFLYAFLSAMGVVLVLSCLLWLGVLPAMIPVKGDATNCVIFHDHIKQNIFMAFAAFAAGLLARQTERKPIGRAVWAIFSLTALCNVLFMVAGRTGHVIVMVLLVYYLVTWDRAKSLMVGGLVLFLMGLFAWANPANPLFKRAGIVVDEVNEWQITQPADITSSSGLRLEWMVNSLKLIRQNPVIGTGTGSFESVYSRLVSDTQMTRTDNPHNEYLMTAVQFGITGLLVLLGFFFVLWHHAGSFQDPLPRTMARGFVLLMLTACLTASPLQDSAEGWFFVFMTALLFSISTKSVPVSDRG